MKKIIGIIVVIVVILGGIFGYKLVYKASPRDFINKSTRVIYANEGINSKDFTPLLTLLDDDKSKEEMKGKLKKLKYISKFYIFSDKEFYDLDEKSFTGVIDTGYWYFLILKDIDKYFDSTEDIYVLKKEYKDKYKLKLDLFMKNYKGLFIFSFGQKNLKDFIAKAGKYLYNKEIEDTLDIKRDDLLGTIIYNNSGTDFYGVNLLTNSSTIKDNSIISEGEIIFDKKESEIFKSSKENRELIKYINKNDIYISVNDFSKLDKIIFNQLTLGVQADNKFIFSLWKSLFGIDVEEILKEIDGELIVDLNSFSIMVKLKENAPESKKIVSLLKNENSIFYTDKKVELKDNILTIGNGFVENTKPYNIEDGIFIFGEIDSPEILGMEDVTSSIEGKNQKIVIKNSFSVNKFKGLIDLD